MKFLDIFLIVAAVLTSTRCNTVKPPRPVNHENHKLLRLLRSTTTNLSPQTRRASIRNLTMKDRLDKKLTETLKFLFKIPQEFYFDTPAVVRSRGYQVETHSVTTADGYILALHHILGPRNATATLGAPKPDVALMMSSVVGSSSDFVINEPHESLGYILTDSGYDVWLGSFRGGREGLNHTHLDADADRRFWDFSADQIALYDYPALINFVLERTGQQKLFFFSFSTSTLPFFMAGSPRAGIMDKLRMAVTLSPVAYVRYPSKYVRTVARLMLTLQHAAEVLGGPLYRSSDLFSSVLYAACNDGSPFRDLCVFITTSFMGGRNRGNYSKNGFAQLLSSSTSGVSVRFHAQLAQQAFAPTFKMYDFGSETANRRHYGSAMPPLYNLSDVTAPVVFCTAPTDGLMSEKDLQQMMRDLPHFVKRIVASQPDFGLFDLVFAKNAREQIYDQLLDILKQY